MRKNSVKLLVIADTHGRKVSLDRILGRNPDASFFLHLGDGLQRFSYPPAGSGVPDFLAVRGNGDYFSNEPEKRLLAFLPRRVLMLHGHRAGAKSGLDGLLNAACSAKADIVLFGHTHEPLLAEKEGVLFLNPGSVAFPRGSAKGMYGSIDLLSEQVIARLIDIRSGEVYRTLRTDFA